MTSRVNSLVTDETPDAVVSCVIDERPISATTLFVETHGVVHACNTQLQYATVTMVKHALRLIKWWCTGDTNYFDVSRLVYPIQGELENQPNAATFV